jgi:hypothetical protein
LDQNPFESRSIRRFGRGEIGEAYVILYRR